MQQQNITIQSGKKSAVYTCTMLDFSEAFNGGPVTQFSCGKVKIASEAYHTF